MGTKLFIGYLYAGWLTLSLWCTNGLVNEEATDLSHSLVATLTSVGIMPRAQVRAERRWGLPVFLS